MDDQSGGVPKRIQAMNEESCIIGLSVPVIGKEKKLHGRLANHKPQKNISFVSRGVPRRSKFEQMERILAWGTIIIFAKNG